MTDLTYQQVTEEIKNRLDIVDVISKFVVLKKSGHNYMGLCPFHNEKTPSFTVTPSRQIFKCFGCGEGGDVLAFLMKINNQSFVDVIQEQAEILGIELPKTSSGKNIGEYKKEKERLLEAVKFSMEFYHNNLLKNEKALEYLEKRGVGEVAIGSFFLGLAPNSNFELKNHLKDFGYTNDEMYKAGLLYEKNGDFLDRFKNRLIIPIMDINNNPIAFGARAILDGQNPKYLNSPDSSIYNKSSVLFGLNRAKDAIKEEDGVIIMEGYFDVISAQVNGVRNAVASCGTALTPQHIKLLSRYTQNRKIYLAFDQDNAGRKATKLGAAVIKEIFSGLGNIKQYDSSYTNAAKDENVCEIRVVSQVGGKDPDEYIREFGAESYRKEIEQAPLLLDFELAMLFKNSPKNPTAQEKSELVQQIVYILQEIKNPIILADYIKNISFKLNIDESVIKRQVEARQIQSEDLYQNVTIEPSKILFKKIAKNNLQIRYERMETNLIKLALQANTPEKKSYFVQAVNGYKPKSEANFKILDNIDKIISESDNVESIAKNLFSKFYNDNEAQKYLSEMIFSSAEFEKLNYNDYINAVQETFIRLNNLDIMHKKEELKKKNRQKDITEEDKITISKEIFEQVRQTAN